MQGVKLKMNNKEGALHSSFDAVDQFENDKIIQLGKGHVVIM